MFQSLSPLAADPILGLMALYRADQNPLKVDLGVGVYKDEQGNTPVMTAVKEAEKRILATQKSKTYVGPSGDARYNQLAAELVFGKTLIDALGKRRVTIQTPGGCGGLRIAAEFIKKANPLARIWVSDPTWPNHIPLLSASGLSFITYPYYDYKQHRIRFDEIRQSLQQAGPEDLVLLHGCCHNPCGADLSPAQWQQMRDLALEKGFTVFIDLAYQGLGDGLTEDVYGVRLMAESLPELLVVSSCSKNFGLYRERVGALSVISENAENSPAVESQLAAVARSNYSMPPDHGALIVQLILDNKDLRGEWDQELSVMRDRINGLRALLVKQLGQAGVAGNFAFIQQEKGMFSFLGLTISQVKELINKYSIYLVDSSRINVAGINASNIEYLTTSIAKVLKSGGS